MTLSFLHISRWFSYYCAIIEFLPMIPDIPKVFVSSFLSLPVWAHSLLKSCQIPICCSVTPRLTPEIPTVPEYSKKFQDIPRLLRLFPDIPTLFPHYSHIIPPLFPHYSYIIQICPDIPT